MYQVIYDSEQINQFAELFLPTKDHLVINLSLVARKKYAPELPDQVYILQRVIVGSEQDREKAKNNLHRHVMRLETPIGSYVDKNEKAIPNEALALYAFIDPKDTVKVLSATLNECVEKISNGEKLPNAFNLYKDHLNKSKSPTTAEQYRQIDLDTKEPDRVEAVKVLLDKTGVQVLIAVETKGGYHLVYKHDRAINNKVLYDFKERTKFEKVDREGKKVKDYWFSITSTPMVIVPGTYQGGFKTRMVKW